MIKIENVEVVGWEHAIRGMRNAKNSWEKMDSGDCNVSGSYKCKDCRRGISDYCVGENDHELCSKLAKGGPVHAKYRRMIVVYLDIVAPLYWWKEFDTYKVGTVANSCSTMHKIHEKEFTLEDFSCEHLIYNSHNSAVNLRDDACVISELGDGYYVDDPRDILKQTINMLNRARQLFLETNDKKYWWQMIQLLPSSYNQRRTIMLNYEVLVGIYRDRKNHKLDEWKEFCKWIESLPYSELITGKAVAKTEYSDLDDYEKLIKDLNDYADKFTRVNVASQEECEAALKEVNNESGN